MKSLLTACRYLTALPIPAASEAGDLGHAAAWFPLIGLVLGGLLALAALGTDTVTPPSVAAVLLVALWALLTGGLHLDGLGDALDGLGGGFGRDEALRLMRTGGIGAYGAGGIVLVLALKIAVLGNLPQDLLWRGLILAPALGRAAPVLLARLCRPARPEGAGQAFSLSVGVPALAIAGGTGLAAALGLLGAWGLVPLFAAGLVTAIFAAYLRWRLGGLTGDCLGALVEVTEAIVLTVLAAFDYLDLNWGFHWGSSGADI
jgi:adenosylcobinamide-GDP ribazoletransferase